MFKHRQLIRRTAPRFLAFSVLVVVSLSPFAQSAVESVDESTYGAEKIGYKTVAAALEGLKSMPGVSITVIQPDGWTIAVEPITKAIWSFAPAGHSAYPAVVRREIMQRDGDVYVETVALCQAEKVPCDNLIREFQLLNQRLSKSMRQRQPKPNEK